MKNIDWDLEWELFNLHQEAQIIVEQLLSFPNSIDWDSE